MSAYGDQGRGQGRDEKRTDRGPAHEQNTARDDGMRDDGTHNDGTRDQTQDRLLSARLQDLLRAASSGQISDISAQPGPFEQGLHLTGHAQKGQTSLEEEESNGSAFPAGERDSVTPMHAKDDRRRVGSRLPDGDSGPRQEPERDMESGERTRVLRGVPAPRAAADRGAGAVGAGAGRAGGSAGSGGSGGSGGFGGSGGGPEGGGGDSELEAVLRSRLHQSVGAVEPAPDTLAYLQHAVPARRAQRRRAFAGAAAAVVLAGVGVPGLASTGLMPGLPGDSSYNASDGHGPSESGGGLEQPGLTRGADGSLGGVGANGGKSAGGDSVSPSPSQGKQNGGAGHDDEMYTSAPSCDRRQLGDGTAHEGTPRPDGKVYGKFRVVNTSHDSCTVEGEGAVGALAQGKADIERIKVVDHTTGDPATLLPDPDLAPEKLVLRPGEAYEVRWAWVPENCGPAGPNEPKTDDVADPGGNAGSGNGGGNSEGTGGGEGPGGPSGSTEGTTGGTTGDSVGGSEGGGGDTDQKASVVLNHTPDVGEPVAADTELEGACAGTLYRTGALEADS